jgi:hypothetical protein
LYCTLLLLATRKYQGFETVPLIWTGGWLFIGVLLGASAMEGLWLPWLLVCPVFLGSQWRRAPESLLIVAGTAPVVAMFETSQVVVCLASFVFFLRLLRGSSPDNTIAEDRRLAMTVSGVFVLLPFLLPLVMERDREIILPPSGAPSVSVAFNTWQVRMPTQSADIRTFWFGPFGDGRHHSLVSCMKFRGIDLEPVKDAPGVYEGSGNWMAEYFIYRGELVDSYGEYLLLSLIPFSTAGVHLILESSTDSVSAAYFSLEARRIADRIALQAQHSS